MFDLHDINDALIPEDSETTENRAVTIDEVYEFLKDEVDSKEEAMELMELFVNLATAGCRIESIDGDLAIVYLSEDNRRLGYVNLMPDIVNVSNPNENVVFVEFADGTKEIAKLSSEDTFNLETGILICIVKKILSTFDLAVSGSSAYNKIIKYALTKLDYNKKAKERAHKHKKAIEQYKKDIERAEAEIKNQERESRINEMAEAYKRAINKVSEEAKVELENDIQGFLEKLAEYDEKESKNDN